MHPSSPFVALALIASSALLAFPARAVEYFVPSVATPTLQAAVDAAAASDGVDDIISITASPIGTFGQVFFGGAFYVDNQLLVRPDPASGLERATIHSFNPHEPIIYMLGVPGLDQGYVTIQDLDLLRHVSGNDNHLVVINAYTQTTLERCRIGLDWPTGGTTGWANIRISYPHEVVVRNCICFSFVPGAFYRGIWATSFDMTSSLFLYNNVIADHLLGGIRIDDGGAPAGPLVLLRNNVVACHPGIDPPPYAFVSAVTGGTLVETSHNTAFASPGEEEFLALGATSIAGEPDAGLDPTFLEFLRPDVVPSFFMWTWMLTPPVDANFDFFRLAPGGPLHDDAGDYGVTVTDGDPFVADIAVVDDIEGDPRPSELPSHTDRGVDQLAMSPVGVEAIASAQPLLWAEPASNPAPAVGIQFRAGGAGRLTFEVFDLAGRRLYRTERPAGAGESGLLEWPAPNRTGVVFYRVRLEPNAGPTAETTGRLVLLR